MVEALASNDQIKIRGRQFGVELVSCSNLHATQRGGPAAALHRRLPEPRCKAVVEFSVQSGTGQRHRSRQAGIVRSGPYLDQNA